MGPAGRTKKERPIGRSSCCPHKYQTLCETHLHRPASGAGRASFSEGQRLHAEAFVEMLDLAEQLIEFALQTGQTFVVHQA